MVIFSFVMVFVVFGMLFNCILGIREDVILEKGTSETLVQTADFIFIKISKKTHCIEAMCFFKFVNDIIYKKKRLE